MVIFHQLPAVAELAPLFAEAKRLQVNCWWDSDELIFDPVAYGQRDDVVGHSEDTINRLLAAVNQHRQALLACDQALAASPPLATAMREAGASQVCLVETAEQLGQVFAAPPSKSLRRLLSANIFLRHAALVAPRSSPNRCRG